MRRSRIGVAIAVALSLVSGLGVAWDLLRRTWPLGRLPLWDGAGNGWGAVELWSALSHGQLVDFLVRLNAQDKWPFGFSLLLMPFVAFGGGSFAAATLLPALAFALVPALLLWAGLEVERDGRGLAAGLLAGALWLASETPRALATVVMRETTGAALGVALLAAYLRARRLGTLASWRLAGGLLLALFFTKYNYFLLSGIAICLHALLELAPDRRRTGASRLVARILRGGWRAPERWAAIGFGATVVAVVAGQNPGNFLYGGLIVATGVALARRWSALRHPRAALAGFAAPARALIETLVVPLWIWSLSPSPIHPKNVIAFLRNREGAHPVFSASSLAYYPRELFGTFLPGEAAAWAIAGLALAGTLSLLRRKRDPARAVALTAAVGCVSLELHPLKEGRFLVSVVPMLFLVATVVAVRALARLLPGRMAARLAFAASALGLSFYGVFRLSSDAGALGRLESDHRLFTGGREYAAPLGDLARRMSGTRRPALIGGFNQLAETLVRWRAWQLHPRASDMVEPLRGLSGADDAARVRAKLEQWLARERPSRIAMVVFVPGSRRFTDTDFLRYNAWQVEAWRAFAHSKSWRHRDRRRFRGLGFDLVSLEPKRRGRMLN